MRCGFYLIAQDPQEMWAELLHALSRPGTRCQADQLMLEGPLDDGLYAPADLAAGLTACTCLQEARILLLPEGTALPNDLPDWEAFRHSPVIAAVYFVDCTEFEVYTQDAALLSLFEPLSASPLADHFEWIDDGNVGRTCF